MQDIHFYNVLYYYASYVMSIHIIDTIYSFLFFFLHSMWKLSKGIQDLIISYLCEEWAFSLLEMFDFTGFEVLWIGIAYFNKNGTTEYLSLSKGTAAQYQNWDREHQQAGSLALCPALTNRISWRNYHCTDSKHYVCEKQAYRVWNQTVLSSFYVMILVE